MSKARELIEAEVGFAVLEDAYDKLLVKTWLEFTKIPPNTLECSEWFPESEMGNVDAEINLVKSLYPNTVTSESKSTHEDYYDRVSEYAADGYVVTVTVTV